MSPDAMSERLFATFRADAERRLDAIERALLELETTGDAELVKAMFRDVHTVKGDAAMCNLPQVTEVLHVFEDLLEQSIAAGRRPRGRSISTLLSVVDHVRGLVERHVVGAPEPPRRNVDELIARLRALDVDSAWTDQEAPSVQRSDRRRRPVEVPSGVLDELVRLVGELSRVRYRIGARALDLGDEGLSATVESAEHVAADLERLALGMRMVPMTTVLQGAERAVRDLSLSLERAVRLEVTGADVEVDFAVRDVVQASLGHLLRNAVDHGIESPEERQAAGKSPTATIVIAFSITEGSLQMTVTDDGRGIDTTRVRERAVALGRPAPSTAAELTELLLQPAFSTRAAVTDVSGRGVGLDVVAAEVRALRGRVDVESTPSVGTTISLVMPLTLAIVEGLLVSAGGSRFVVPSAQVAGCVAFDRARCVTAGADRGLYDAPSGALPYVDLARLGGSVPREDSDSRRTLVEVRVAGARAGIVVDEMLGIERRVVSGLDPILKRVPYLLGTTMLGDGAVGLVVEVGALLGHMAGEHPRQEARR